MNNRRKNALIRSQLRELKGEICSLEHYLLSAKKCHKKINYGFNTYDSINSITFSAMIKLANMRKTLIRDGINNHLVELADGSKLFFPTAKGNNKGDLDYIRLCNRKGEKPKCLKLVDLY